jgi:uncharacterized phiE125 gp8 family phage protein
VSAIKLVTASTAEPVTRTEAKLWLRLDEHDVAEDALVDSLIARARQRWEEVKQRAAMVQTFDYYLDAEPEDSCPVQIPKAPLVSVDSIRAFGSDEATDTGGTAMSTSGYYVDTAHEFGRVMPLSAFSYPSASREINPVIIRFTAGYSTATTGVPETVKTEIKEIVARLYEHRGDEVGMLKALEDALTETDLPTWG